MKIFIVKIIFFTFIATNVFCMNSELIILPKGAEVNTGEFVSVVFRIWPVENANTEELKKIEGQTLFGGLYVNEIQSLAPSENNADVFEIKALGVITGEIPSSKLFFNYLGQEIPVKYQSLNIKLTENKTKDFYVLDQGVDLKFKPWLTILLAIMFLSGVVFFFRKKLLGVFEQKKTDDPRKAFKNLFISAKNREDFEKIYSEKENWLPLLTIKTQAHADFFNTINQYQYKMNWSHAEQIEVETSFDQIRRSFE